MSLKRIFPCKFKSDYKKSETPKYKNVNFQTYRNKSDIDLNIEESTHSFYVRGEDVMILAELLPEDYEEGKKDFEPIDFRNDYGFVYNRNEINRKNLYKFLFKINKLHRIYTQQNKIIDFSKPKKKDIGILGYEVDYKKPKWFIKLIKKYDGDLDIYKYSKNLVFSEKNNPIILKDKTFLFNRHGFYSRESPISYLKGLRREWGRVFDEEIRICFNEYPKYANYDTKKIDMGAFKRCKSFIIRLPYHLMFGAIIGNDIIIMDNDDDEIFEYRIEALKKLIKTSEKKEKFKVSFYPRKIEQNDGSCARLSFIRAFMISEFGFDSVDKPVPPAYAVFFNMILTEYDIRHGMKKGYY